MVMTRIRRQSVAAAQHLNFLEFNPVLGDSASTAQKQANFDLLQDAVVEACRTRRPLLIPSPFPYSDQDNTNQDFRYLFKSKYDVVEQATGSYPGTQIQSTTIVNLPNAVHPQRLRVIIVANDGGNAGMLPSKVLKYDGSSPYAANTFRASGTITDGLCSQITMSTALATGDVVIIRAGIFIPAPCEITGLSRVGVELLFDGCSAFMHGDDFDTGVAGTALLNPLATGTSNIIISNLAIRGTDQSATVLHAHNFGMSFNSGNVCTLIGTTIDRFSIGRHVKAPAQGWTYLDDYIVYNEVINQTARTPAFGEWFEGNLQGFRIVKGYRYGEISVSDSGNMLRGKAKDGTANTGGNAFHGANLYGQQNYGGQWGSKHAGVGQTQWYGIGNPLGPSGRKLARSQDIIIAYRDTSAGITEWVRCTHIALASLSSGVRDIDVTQEYGLRIYTGSASVGAEIPPDSDFRKHADVLNANDVYAVEIDFGSAPTATAEVRVAFAPTTWLDAVRMDGGSANDFEWQLGGAGRGLNITGVATFESNRISIPYVQLVERAVLAEGAVDNMFWVRQKNPFVAQRFEFTGASARNSIMPFGSRFPTQLKRTSGTQAITGVSVTALQFDASATDLDYESAEECPRRIDFDLKTTVSNSSAAGAHSTTMRLLRDVGDGAGFVALEEWTVSYYVAATGTDYELNFQQTFYDATTFNLVNVALPVVSYKLDIENSHANTTFTFRANSALSVMEVNRP